MRPSLKVYHIGLIYAKNLVFVFVWWDLYHLSVADHQNQIDFLQKRNVNAAAEEFSGRSHCHQQGTFPPRTYLTQFVPVHVTSDTCPIWQDILLHLFWADRTQQHAALVLLEGSSPSDWGGWTTAHVVIRPPVQSRTPSQCFLSSLIHLSSLKYHSRPHPQAWNDGNSPVMELLVINQYSWPRRWTHNINYYNSCASFEE